MNNLPQGFFLDELYCFPAGLTGDAKFAVIPGAPAVEHDESGAGPSLLVSPAGATLALTGVWLAGAQELDRALAAIAKRHPELDAVRVAGAQLENVSATLTVHAGAGASHALGPQPASALPANRAVFSASLTAPEKAAALGAFRGETGLLTLRYAATLVLDEAATVEISGDLSPAIRSLAPPAKKSGGFFNKKPDLPPSPTLAACNTALDAALAAGQLVVTNKATPNASPALLARAKAPLIATLAQTMLDRLTQMGADAIYLTALPVKLSNTAPERAAFPVEREADLGTWFAAHGREQWITQIAQPLPEPQR